MADSKQNYNRTELNFAIKKTKIQNIYKNKPKLNFNLTQNNLNPDEFDRIQKRIYEKKNGSENLEQKLAQQNRTRVIMGEHGLQEISLKPFTDTALTVNQKLVL